MFREMESVFTRVYLPFLLYLVLYTSVFCAPVQERSLNNNNDTDISNNTDFYSNNSQSASNNISSLEYTDVLDLTSEKVQSTNSSDVSLPFNERSSSFNDTSSLPEGDVTNSSVFVADNSPKNDSSVVDTSVVNSEIQNPEISVVSQTKTVASATERLKTSEKLENAVVSPEEEINTTTGVNNDVNVAQTTTTTATTAKTTKMAPLATTTHFIITTTTEMTTTTTAASDSNGAKVATDRTGVPCMVNFQENPENPRQYKVATYDGSFIEDWLTCPTNLVWNNETCQCDWPKVKVDPNCKCCKQGLMKHEKDRRLYKQYTNGVWVEKSCVGSTSVMIWDDENCLCKWDEAAQKAKKMETWKPVPVPEYNMQCVKLLDMNLDKDYSNDVRIGRYIQLISAARRIRFKAVKGSKNGAMAIRRSPLQVSSFQNNGLTKNVYLKFSFKTHPNQRNSYNKMTILTNGCSGDKPSLAVSFIPANETLEVKLRTASKELHLFLKVNKDANWWYETEIYLYDKHLVVKVNNKEIYKSNGLRGEVQKTSCPLTIAGSKDNPRVGWDGFLDEIYMVKQCPYPKLYPEKLMKTGG